MTRWATTGMGRSRGTPPFQLCALGGLSSGPVRRALDQFPEDFGLAPSPAPARQPS
jgi:hypothetical protein